MTLTIYDNNQTSHPATLAEALLSSFLHLGIKETLWPPMHQPNMIGVIVYLSTHHSFVCRHFSLLEAELRLRRVNQHLCLPTLVA
jgi:hypothetical protein